MSGIDQQGIGNIGSGTAPAEQDHNVDPMRLAHVPCGAVGCPQLGEFLCSESVVVDARMLSCNNEPLPAIPQPEYHVAKL